MARPFFLLSVGDYHHDVHPSTPFIWCGFGRDPKLGKGHIFKKGKEGLEQGVKFYSRADALNAGVSGPNTPYVNAELLPDRGMVVLQCEDEDEGEGRDAAD